MNRNFFLKACNFPILCLLCLSACARLPTTVPVAGEKPSVQSAADLVKQLESKAAEIQSMKGKGNVSVLSPQKNYTGNVLVTEVKPAVLRVDVLNFWGQPVIAFLMNAQEIKLLVYPESKLYRGPANSTNLSRFIPLPVTIQDFMALLTGRIAFSQYEKPVLLANTDPNALNLQLTSMKGGEQVSLAIDSQSLNITSAHWRNAQGQEIMQAEFGEFMSQGPITGPREIKLASGDQTNQVRVHFRDLTYNIPASAESLELPVAGGVRELSFPK
jgi:outer membrane biogenesis lipoprotein LolB